MPGWFESFKTKFYKTYATDADEQRAYANFLTNLDLIYSINADSNIPYWVTANL